MTKEINDYKKSAQSGFKYSLPDNYQFDEQAQKAYQYLTVEKKSVIFLTGRAGTGKTTFIHYVKKNYTGKAVILTPTGMTALNIGGQTIHSFFRFPPRTFESDEINDFYNKIIDHLDLIIIDEISMVQSDVIDHIDFALRKWRKSSVPFAGIQMLLIGDCFQLSPWIKYGAEKQRFEEKYRSQWFFDANVFDEVNIDAISLSNIHRQRDLRFINILNRIRIKHNHEKFIQELNQCCYFDKKNLTTEDQLILTTTNKRADTVNAGKLQLINSPSWVYLAITNGKITKEINNMVPSRLELKIGAQVMVTKNIDGAANGTLAIIKELCDDKVIIETLNDLREVKCSVETWEQYKYDWHSSTKKITSQKTGEYRQIPLRLGWAITIHKSQGLTFDSIKVDLTGGAFSPGQTYVALSRCRTLENITLDKPISLNDVIVDPKSIDFYTKITSQGQELQIVELPQHIENTLNKSNLEMTEPTFSEAHNMRINIRNIATKIISAREGRDTLSFAIKTLVENTTDSENVSFLLQGFDDEGFLFYEIKINEVIPIGESKVINAKEVFVEKELFKQIVEWKIKSKEENSGMSPPVSYDDDIPF